MSKGQSAAKIKLSSFDELFGIDDAEQIVYARLEELHPFKNHPFRVLDDAKMDETTKSIKQYGVLVPGIVRIREEGGYEIIAGHRRRRGAEKAGLERMPVIVRNYTDDEATIVMVDSNIQREDLLPSEKAKAYSMKYEAMKHQGKKGGGNTLDEVGNGQRECEDRSKIYLADKAFRRFAKHGGSEKTGRFPGSRYLISYRGTARLCVGNSPGA